jgi:hypothetical protein
MLNYPELDAEDLELNCGRESMKPDPWQLGTEHHMLDWGRASRKLDELAAGEDDDPDDETDYVDIHIIEGGLNFYKF